MEILPAIAMIAALVVIYKYLPNRKVFVYFCISLVIVFGISAVIGRQRTEQEHIDKAAIQAMIAEQKVFVKWYKNYQRELEQLDRIWQTYHSLVQSYADEDIDVDELLERLNELEQEARREQVNIYTVKVPEELGSECAAAVEQLIRKTQEYTDAQTQTISQTKEAIQQQQIDEHDELLRTIQNIMIRSSPIGLFTASEQTDILNYFNNIDNK